MFCPKCGTKVIEGAAFCQKCGEKLNFNDTTQPAVDSPATPTRQASGASGSAPQKKKKKTLPIVLGIAVILILLLVIIASIGGNDEPSSQSQQPSAGSDAGVDLSKTYTNADAGISFRYPANWEITEEGDLKIVEMIDSDNAPGHRIWLQINDIIDTDPFNVFSGDTASIKAAVNEFHTFLSVEDSTISGVPVRVLKYRTEGLGGIEIVQNYYYTNGDDRYLIQCAYSESLADSCEKLFDDMIDSYTITVVTPVRPSSTEQILGVKGGTNSAYPGVTYGEAFENFFSNPSWRYFVGTQEGPDEDGDGEPDYTVENIDVVEFTGGCLYAGVEVTALIQFALDNEAGTFQPVYLSFNEVPQNMLMLSGLMDTVFSQAIEDLGGSTTAPAPSQSIDSTEPTQEDHPSTATKSDTIFETDYYTLTIPASWDGRYAYEQDGSNLTFYELESYYDGWGGKLFGISLREDEEFLDFPGYYSIGALVELSDGGSAPTFLYYVVVSTPTDVQFSDDAAETYIEMSNNIDSILASLSAKGGYAIMTD